MCVVREWLVRDSFYGFKITTEERIEPYYGLMKDFFCAYSSIVHTASNCITAYTLEPIFLSVIQLRWWKLGVQNI